MYQLPSFILSCSNRAQTVSQLFHQNLFIADVGLGSQIDVTLSDVQGLFFGKKVGVGYVVSDLTDSIPITTLEISFKRA